MVKAGMVPPLARRVQCERLFGCRVAFQGISQVAQDCGNEYSNSKCPAANMPAVIPHQVQVGGGNIFGCSDRFWNFSRESPPAHLRSNRTRVDGIDTQCGILLHFVSPGLRQNLYPAVSDGIGAPVSLTPSAAVCCGEQDGGGFGTFQQWKQYLGEDPRGIQIDLQCFMS